MCAYLMKASQSVGVYSVMFMFACVMSQGLYQSEYNHNTVIRGSTTPSRQRRGWNRRLCGGGTSDAGWKSGGDDKQY